MARLGLSSKATTDLVCLAVHGDTLLVGGGMGELWWRVGDAWSASREVPAELIQNVAFSREAGWFLLTDQALYRLVNGSAWRRVSWFGGEMLCAVDSLLYCGNLYRFDLSVAGFPMKSMYPHFPVAGLHAAGPNMLLTFGHEGQIAWFDAGLDSFAMDAASCLQGGQVMRCLDGSLLLLSGRNFLLEDGDRWRYDTPRPPDALGPSIEAFDGLSSRDYCYLRRGHSYDPEYHWFSLLDHVVDGTWEATLQFPGYTQTITLTRDGVPLFPLDQDVYRVEGGSWSQENSLPAAYDAWDLYRTSDGDVYAVQYYAVAEGPVYRRADGIWTPVLTLRAPLHGWTMAVAGRYPEALYLFTSSRLMGLHLTDTDSLYVEEFYEDLVGMDVRAIAWAEGPAGVYIATAYPGYVLLLSGVPGNHRLEIVAGPLLEAVASMAVGPDGSLVLVAPSTGRLYRLPAESLVP